jgi:hypothetical protein
VSKRPALPVVSLSNPSEHSESNGSESKG